MSTRTTLRKRKRFVIIAIIAVIIAELGYILYSFGFFSQTGPTAQPLANLLYDLCLQTGAGAGFCRGQTFKLLTDYLNSFKYISIRIVNPTNTNIRQLADEFKLLSNFTRPIVDVYLVGPGGLDYAQHIVNELNSTLNGMLKDDIFATYPVLNFTIYTRYILPFILIVPKKIVTPSQYTRKEVFYSTPLINATYVATSNISSCAIVYNIVLKLEHPITNLEEIRKYINITGLVYRKHGARYNITKLILMTRILVYSYNKSAIALKYAAFAGDLKRGDKVTLLIRSILVKKAVVKYYVISVTQPTLIVIGNKDNYEITCLIAPYNSTAETLKELIQKCIE